MFYNKGGRVLFMINFLKGFLNEKECEVFWGLLLNINIF